MFIMIVIYNDKIVFVRLFDGYVYRCFWSLEKGGSGWARDGSGLGFGI